MLLPLIGTGVSLISSIVGGISANKKQNETEELLEQQQKTLDQWYEKEMDTNYLDSKVAKSTLSYLREKNEKEEEKNNNSVVKNGATAEERVALASALNQNYAQSVAKLSELGEERKNQVEDRYLSEKAKLDSTEYAASLANAATVSGASLIGSSIGNTLSTISRLK